MTRAVLFAALIACGPTSTKPTGTPDPKPVDDPSLLAALP